MSDTVSSPSSTGSTWSCWRHELSLLAPLGVRCRWRTWEQVAAFRRPPPSVVAQLVAVMVALPMTTSPAASGR
jgi:hypothetical protein